MTQYCSASGKVMHLTSNDAMRAIGRMTSHGLAKGNVYRCDICKAWHQTHGFSKTPQTKNFKRKKRGY